MPFVPPGGVSPISAFLLDTTGVAPGALIAMLADPIDLATGDYLSLERGFDPTDAAFFTAMRTVRNSGSAVENVGQNFADHARVDGALDSFMREEIRLTSKDLVASGDLAINAVTVTPDGDTANIYIEFENIARDEDGRLIRLPPSLLVGAAP